jgi:sialate O-acetylesterase
MARAALATVYGKEVHYRAPEISTARSRTDETTSVLTVELEFDHVGGYLLVTGPKEQVFTMEDDEGDVEVRQWSISGRNTILLTPGRPFRGQAFVHGGADRNPSTFFPLDSLTYMPVVSFYKFPVNE